MPGPMAACARSTGAMLPRWRWASATGSSALSAVTNSRRVAVGASARTRPADEDDAGGESVGADAPTCRLSPLRSHRPGAGDAKPARIDRIEKGLPACAGGAVLTIALGLLEGVVDGDWEGRMRLLGETVHRLRHAVEEERFRLLLAAMAVGRGNQLLGLGHGERGEEVWKDRLQGVGAARRRRSPTGRRSRYCRSREDRCTTNALSSCAVSLVAERCCATPCWALYGIAKLRTFATTSTHSEKPELAPPKGEPSAKSQIIGIACFARLRSHRVVLGAPRSKRRSVVSKATNRHGQIHCNRIGVGCGTGAAGIERSTVVGRPAAKASRVTRSRASCTRSEKVVKATSWRGVKRSPNLVSP